MTKNQNRKRANTPLQHPDYQNKQDEKAAQ